MPTKKLKIIDCDNTDLQFDEHFPENSIGFRTQNVQLFKTILHFIEVFLSELNFRINSEGIFITSMDSNHISLIDCFIPCEMLGLYNCQDEIVRGFDFKALNKILSHLNYDDDLIMIFNEDTTELRYINSKYTKYYTLKNMSIDSDMLDIKDMVEMTYITMDSKYFSSIINNFVDIGDNLRIKLLESKKKISLKSQSDISDLKIVLNNDDMDIKNFQDICLEFNIKNILSFSKGYNISENIQIKIGPDVPIQMSFNFKSKGFLHYYVAPKISDV